MKEKARWKLLENEQKVKKTARYEGEGKGRERMLVNTSTLWG